MRFFFHLIDWRQNLAFLLSLESNMRPQEHQGPWFCFQTGLHRENIRAGRWLHLYLPCKQGDLRLDPQRPHKSQLQCTLESLALDKQTKELWDALARQHSWISELQLQRRPCQRIRQSATGRSWGRSLAATRLCVHTHAHSPYPHTEGICLTVPRNLPLNSLQNCFPTIIMWVKRLRRLILQVHWRAAGWSAADRAHSYHLLTQTSTFYCAPPVGGQGKTKLTRSAP